MTKQHSRFSILSLAIPLLIEQILRNFLGTVNILMLGNFSDNAVAAVGVANQIINFVQMIFTSLSAAAAILINQYLGASKDEDAGKTGMNVIGISILFGLVVVIIMLFGASSFIRLIGLEEGLVRDSSIYLEWVGGAAIFMAVSSMISVVFRCHGNAKIPMAVVMLANIINATGTYLVLYRPFEIPLYGTEGIGIVRFFSEMSGFIVILVLMVRAQFPFHRLVYLWKIKLTDLKQIAKLAVMSSMESISYNLAQLFTTAMIASFGAIMISTKTYVNTIDYYAFIAGLSIGQAAQIISGQLMGAGRFEKAYHLVRKVWIALLISNILFSGSIYIFHRPIIGLFTSNETIINMSAPLFALCIIMNLGRSLTHSFNWGLRAAGYVFWPMIVAVSSIWVVSVGLGFVFSTVMGLGLVGLWIAMMMDEVLRGILNCSMWLSKRWKKSVMRLQNVTEVFED